MEDSDAFKEDDADFSESFSLVVSPLIDRFVVTFKYAGQTEYQRDRQKVELCWSYR